MKLIIEGERWRDVVGYEGLYEVSNLGRVKSVGRSGTRGGLLKGEVTKGYLRFPLSKRNVSKRHLAHRLVAKSFIEKEDGKQFINHLDGNKTNNFKGNLEWCTRSENQVHAYELGLQKINVKEAHRARHESQKREVAKLDMDGSLLEEFDSIQETAQSLGRSDGSHISAVARGKRSHTGGYKWKYI